LKNAGVENSLLLDLSQTLRTPLGPIHRSKKLRGHCL